VVPNRRVLNFITAVPHCGRSMTNDTPNICLCLIVVKVVAVSSILCDTLSSLVHHFTSTTGKQISYVYIQYFVNADVLCLMKWCFLCLLCSSLLWGVRNPQVLAMLVIWSILNNSYDAKSIFSQCRMMCDCLFRAIHYMDTNNRFFSYVWKSVLPPKTIKAQKIQSTQNEM
jgi:hypothetical protein